MPDAMLESLQAAQMSVLREPGRKARGRVVTRVGAFAHIGDCASGQSEEECPGPSLGPGGRDNLEGIGDLVSSLFSPASA